jgi:hypothetical protein
MFNAKLLVEPLVVVVVLHPPLTQVVVVQALPEHVVLCVRALAADVNISTILRLKTTVSSIRNSLVFLSKIFL